MNILRHKCIQNWAGSHISYIIYHEREFDKLNILHQECIQNWSSSHIVKKEFDKLNILHQKCIQNWAGSHIVKANGRIKMPVTSISTTAKGRNNNQAKFIQEFSNYLTKQAIKTMFASYLK